MKNYIKQFSIIIAICALGAILSAKYILHDSVPIAFWICFGFIAVASIVINKTLSDAGNMRPQLFVAYFMGSLTAKLLLSAALLVAVGLIDRESLKFTAIWFLVTYTLLTILEIKNLLPKLKNNTPR